MLWTTPSKETNPPSAGAARWLEVVGEQVNRLRFGVVQIVVHDGRVVQIEKTEKVRFDKPDGHTT